MCIYNNDHAMLIVWLLALAVFGFVCVSALIMSRWRSVDTVDDLNSRLISLLLSPIQTHIEVEPDYFTVTGKRFSRIHLYGRDALLHSFVLEYTRFRSLLRDFVYQRFCALSLPYDVRVAIGRLLCSLLSVTCFVTNEAAPLSSTP